MKQLRQDVHLPIYSVIVMVAVMVVSPIASIVASVKIAERNAIEMAAEQRARSCTLYERLLDAYDETPPTTQTGRNVRQAYLDQYRSRSCEPPRK